MCCVKYIDIRTVVKAFSINRLTLTTINKAIKLSLKESSTSFSRAKKWAPEFKRD